MRFTNQTRGRRARSTALLSAAVLAASGIVATMGAANAVVTGGGADNPQGTPGFYRDAQGLALQLCTDPGATEALCGPETQGAVDGHLGTYFAASADAGPLSASWAVEAIEDEVTAEPMVLNATRFDIDGARPNTRYLIKDPWGTRPCRTDAAGRASCRAETSGDFGTVRNGRVTTFLRGLGGGARQFIGNADVGSQVTGSPTGFNRVTLIGPNRTWSTNRFAVLGLKRDNTAMSALNAKSLQLGNGRQTGVVSKSVRYFSIGTANARPTVRKGGANAAAFNVRDNCAAQAPGTACDITVTFRPGQNANSVKRAFLVINDNGLAAPRRVSLKGIGS